MSEAKLYLKSDQSIVNSHQHDFHQLVLPVNGRLALEIGHMLRAQASYFQGKPLIYV